jgi:hypothetical protein
VKRSTSISLTIVPALAAACGPNALPPDPCLPSTYTAPACEYAVQHQGYYYGGTFYPHVYSSPFLYYSNGYSNYVAGGGRVSTIAPGRFAPGGGASGAVSAPSSTTRGGFGGTGAAHASAGAGAGE